MQHVGQWPGVRTLLPRALRNAHEELMKGQNHSMPWNLKAALREAIAQAFEATC